MNRIILLFLVLLQTACSETPKSKVQRSPSSFKSRYDALLRKCAPISFDTLMVHSSEELDGDNYRYRGQQLTRSEIFLLPKEFAAFYLQDSSYSFNACYKFSIGKGLSALIIRTPSKYESSSIKLFVLDTRQDSIVQYIELAELWGDAGQINERKSWIFKEKGVYKAFIWDAESYDHRVEDEQDTTIDRTNTYSLLNIADPESGGNFDQRALLQKYGTLLR